MSTEMIRSNLRDHIIMVDRMATNLYKEIYSDVNIDTLCSCGASKSIEGFLQNMGDVFSFAYVRRVCGRDLGDEECTAIILYALGKYPAEMCDEDCTNIPQWSNV